jgi:hypothetical protein
MILEVDLWLVNNFHLSIVRGSVGLLDMRDWSGGITAAQKSQNSDASDLCIGIHIYMIYIDAYTI